MAGSVDYTGELSEVPFEPGESPFKMKGVAIRGVFERTKDQPHGIVYCISQLKDPRLRGYMSQHFLASAWYDMFAFLAVGDLRPHFAGARTPADYYRYIFTEGYKQADVDIKGVFRALVHLITPGMVCERVVTISSRYFNFGSAEKLHNGARELQGIRRGVPRAMLHWHSPAVSGYMQRVLELSGAEDVHVEFGEPTNERLEHGVAVVDVIYTATWR